MAAREFRAEVRQTNSAAIIDLHGEIDALAEEDLLNRAYAEATLQNPTILILNFVDVDYINSKGIALIVGVLAKARRAGIRLLVFGLSDHYQEIFKITRLADFMTVFPDEATALRQAV
ncbi:MAG: STAS domain-containing protein [Chloroflexi bacterium]|nr:STAS domain-containing protein [Chloroflexota bacterium]